METKAVLSVIDKIAEKLAVPTTEILRAYAVSGIKLIPDLFVSGFISLGMIILIVISVRMIVRSLPDDSDWRNTDWKTDQRNEFILAMCCVVGVVSTVFFFMSLTSFCSTASKAILWWYDPKAYAILEVMGKFVR